MCYSTLSFFRQSLLLIASSILSLTVHAIPKYDEGAIIVSGIQFLQDHQNLNEYFYIPQYPRVSKKDDGTLELMCMKYVSPNGTNNNGGVFHALIEFTLAAELLPTLEAELRKTTGKSDVRIVGPVPLQQAVKDGEQGLASFQIVSSVLKENTFTKSIITSGFAPFVPGSKAAISARLSQEGATLLFSTLERPTSDVSVSLSGYYEAAVKAYQAEVVAEAKVVYEHFSRILHRAEGYSKKEVRNVTDIMIRDQVIKVQSFDRGNALNVNTKDMEAILNMVTDKLIELMFDAQVGWSKEPERIAAVSQNQIPMRQEPGFFGQLFSGTGNQPYVSDQQYVLKKIKDERLNKFYLNLSKSTTIKVPIYTSGNLAFLSETLKPEEKKKYFFTVNLDDPDFQQRDLVIQLDGAFAEGFTDVLNNVSVSVRKVYGNNHPDFNKDAFFDKKSVETGAIIQHVYYSRLGSLQSDWLDYEYQVAWSLKGNTKSVSSDQWVRSSGSVLTLIPPFEKKTVEVDADRGLFKDSDIISATVRFTAIVLGKPTVVKTLILRASDTEITSKMAIISDPGTLIGYQVTWNKREGELKDPVKTLDKDYIVLTPR